MAKNKKDNDSNSPAGLLFVGCMFVGMGLGFLYDQLVVGLFAGMGVGFLAMGIWMAYSNKKSK